MQHVVATAGHVDHGKSTLVRALTGREPDRWEEERRRGLTIDLGFAWTTLALGVGVAFVDVPGHQRFTANMLAGVGSVPVVLFVVAADEGWSHQSGEHLAALHALRVRHGVLAVTRSDLADPAPVLADAGDRLAATSLGVLPRVAVSGRTGEGLDALRAALARVLAALPAPPPAARARLWVDRAFTVRGSGTVVTGTLPTGRVAVRDELEVLPGGRRVRVRSLQTMEATVPAVDAVARVGLNVRDVPRADLPRGVALCTPGSTRSTSVVDVRLSRPEHGGAEVRRDGSSVDEARFPATAVLHVGSAAVPVAVRPLGTQAARLTLEQPLPLLVGDRGVLRDPGAQRVVAGALVVDPAPPALRRRGAARARAEVLAGLDGHPDPVGEVARRGPVTPRELVALGALEPGEAPPDDLLDVGGVLALPEHLTAWRAALRDAVDTSARERPLDGGLPREAARQALRLPDARVLAAVLAAEPGVRDTAGRLTSATAGPALPPPAAAALAALRRVSGDAPFSPPAADQLAGLGLSPAVLAALDRAGEVLRLPGGVVLLADAEDEAVRRLSALPSPFTTAQAKTALATTRRVAVPLLEHLDARGRTRRLDSSLRELRPSR